MSYDVRKTNQCVYKGYLYNDDPEEAWDECVAKVGIQADNCMTDTLDRDMQRYPKILGQCALRDFQTKVKNLFKLTTKLPEGSQLAFMM